MIKRTLALSAVAAIIGALSMPVIAAPATGAGGKAGAPGQLKDKTLGETGKNHAPGQVKKLPICDDDLVAAGIPCVTPDP